MSRGVGHRPGSGLVLLWLWRRRMATALIRPLAWKPKNVTEEDKKKKKKKKKKEKRKKRKKKKKLVRRK